MISLLAVVFCVGISAAGTSVAADAPLASDNDNPAALNNGTAHARLFRFDAFFAFDMVESSHTFAQVYDFSNPGWARKVSRGPSRLNSLHSMVVEAQRRLPPPWKVEALDGGFKVVDYP